MSDKRAVGLDIGTNMIVMAETSQDGKTIFKMERDAFYCITPKTALNRNSIQKALEKGETNYIIDGNNFVIVGEDALLTAIERNGQAQRPMCKGIISPREKRSLPMLKMIIESLIGKGEEGDRLVYSVPGNPIDAKYDIEYHTDIMGTYLSQMGYLAIPINEAFAIALSELLDENLTGVTLSWGAGMVNAAVIHQGDPLIEFSLTRSGDFIDEMVGKALDISPSVVQLEKEAGVDLNNPTSKLMEAVGIYYHSVIKYALENIVYELEKREKDLPLFREPVSIVASGGLAQATGFVDAVVQALGELKFPFDIKGVRKATDPMKAVANGALLAAQL